MVALRDAALCAVDGMRHEGIVYATEPRKPKIIEARPKRDLYVMGGLVDCRGTGFTRLLAYHIKDGRYFSPEFSWVEQQLHFVPDWALMFGIELANGWDMAPLYRNLSDEQLSEAVLLGVTIMKKVRGAKHVTYVHYSVDNREINPHVVNIG